MSSDTATADRVKTRRLTYAAHSFVAALMFTATAAHAQDGVQDTDFPVGYWAVDYFEGHAGFSGSASFGTPQSGTGGAGGPVWRGEAFRGVGALGAVVVSATGTGTDGRLGQFETPTDPVVPPGYVGDTWTSAGNPYYQIDHRRTARFDGDFRVGYDPSVFMDDGIEVYINGALLYSIYPGGPSTSPYLNAGDGLTFPIVAGDEILMRFINLGFIGGYSMALQEVPEDPTLDKVLTSNADEDSSSSVSVAIR